MNLNTHFHPRSDADLLAMISEQAWKATHDEIAGRIHGFAGEALAGHLESLYPPADMAVLSTYDCAQPISEVLIRVRLPNSDRWSEQVAIPLPRPVTVARSYQFLYIGGPRLSLDPDAGLSAETACEIREGRNGLFRTWEEFVSHHRAELRRRAPDSIEEAIFEMAKAYREFRERNSHLAEWPREYHQEHGCYPTWMEIAAHFSLPRALVESLLARRTGDRSRNSVASVPASDIHHRARHAGVA